MNKSCTGPLRLAENYNTEIEAVPFNDKFARPVKDPVSIRAYPNDQNVNPNYAHSTAQNMPYGYSRVLSYQQGGYPQPHYENNQMQSTHSTYGTMNPEFPPYQQHQNTPSTYSSFKSIGQTPSFYPKQAPFQPSPAAPMPSYSSAADSLLPVSQRSEEAYQSQKISSTRKCLPSHSSFNQKIASPGYTAKAKRQDSKWFACERDQQTSFNDYAAGGSQGPQFAFSLARKLQKLSSDVSGKPERRGKKKTFSETSSSGLQPLEDSEGVFQDDAVAEMDGNTTPDTETGSEQKAVDGQNLDREIASGEGNAAAEAEQNATVSEILSLLSGDRADQQDAVSNKTQVSKNGVAPREPLHKFYEKSLALSAPKASEIPII